MINATEEIRGDVHLYKKKWVAVHLRKLSCYVNALKLGHFKGPILGPSKANKKKKSYIPGFCYLHTQLNDIFAMWLLCLNWCFLIMTCLLIVMLLVSLGLPPVAFSIDTCSIGTFSIDTFLIDLFLHMKFFHRLQTLKKECEQKPYVFMIGIIYVMPHHKIFLESCRNYFLVVGKKQCDIRSDNRSIEPCTNLN